MGYKPNKRVFELAAYFYEVDYHTIEKYYDHTHFDFNNVSLEDVYSQDEKNKKLRSDLKMIERRYKIEKIFKNHEKV